MATNETSRLLPYEDPRDSFNEEQRALLRDEENRQIRRERRRLILCLVLAIVLTSSAIVFTYFFARLTLGRSRNVIMMVSDGFGPASQTYSREYIQYVYNLTEDYMTPLDQILIGSSRTRSSSSFVTDSAAGATAFSCGKKTFNAGVGVDKDGIPCGTILEAAKELGMLTGIVVTSRVTDATPASFSAHVTSRFMEEDIAKQQIGDYVLGRRVDLLMGGGQCFFLPNTTKDGGCRTDGRNLLQEAKDFGWENLMLTRQDFDALAGNKSAIPLPALGLFRPRDLSFELDRDPKMEPSLSEMVKAALISLKDNAGTAQGFFLLIEGSRIDIAGHFNDPAAHIREILEYQSTVKVVREFVAKNPGTLMISTSDHETGGFTLGSQPDPNTYPEYLWKPEVIKRVTASTDLLGQKLLGFPSHDIKRRREFVRKTILKDGLGISDPTEEEIAFLAKPEKNLNETVIFMGHAVSKRAMLGWTTQGHTGVDVNLYADGDGDGFKDLRGNHENIEIGAAMSKYLGIDLDFITWKLSRSLDKWFKPKGNVEHSGLEYEFHRNVGN